MILIKRTRGNRYNVYNIVERSRSPNWSPTIAQAIVRRFNATSTEDYSNISLEEALAKGGNDILWYIPISEPITEDEIKQQYPEFFI